MKVNVPLDLPKSVAKEWVAGKVDISNVVVRSKETGKIIIEATDTDGLKSIEVNLNGRKYVINDINKTEATFGLDLINGTNTISIKITNINGLTAEGSTEFNYAS